MRFRTIPNWLHKPSHNFDSNWAPLSVVIVAGVPNRAIHPLKKVPATISALISTSSIASDQRVIRSTQVSRYLKPSAYGKGPTISICMCQNMYVVKSLCGFVEFAENWLIMARYFSGLATFTRTAPLSNVYIHSVPDKSCINQRFRSSMRWMT